MSKPRKTLLVTDLDNTLWDWVEIWYRPFHRMLAQLAASSGVPVAQLEREIRIVHQRHGTSEYAFVIEELPSLREIHGPEADLKVVYESAIEAFRRERSSVLVPYPSVVETLGQLRERGARIVAYTESMAYYTAYRLRRTGIDQLLDCLYSPEDHALPAPLSEIRTRPAEHYELSTRHHHTPRGELKPNPRLLLDILADAGVKPEEAVYVGDSLMKDIAMAQNAGVLDVHAAYGAAQHTEAYALLRRVSHWNDADVEREKEILSRPTHTPTLSIHRTFAELLELVDFS